MPDAWTAPRLLVGGEAGLGWVNLRALDDSTLLPEGSRNEDFGAALGLHGIIAWGLGAAAGLRAQVTDCDDFDLWQFNVEAQWRVPIFGPRELDYEASLRMGLGYALLDTDLGGSEPFIAGVDARVGVGLDYYLADWVSLGASADVGILHLRRSGSFGGTGSTGPGSATGLGANLSVLVTCHRWDVFG
jgi:hypothetical protein